MPSYNGCGESIYVAQGSSVEPHDPVDAWYQGYANYDYKNEKLLDEKYVEGYIPRSAGKLRSNQLIKRNDFALSVNTNTNFFHHFQRISLKWFGKVY